MKIKGMIPNRLSQRIKELMALFDGDILGLSGILKNIAYSVVV